MSQIPKKDGNILHYKHLFHENNVIVVCVLCVVGSGSRPKKMSLFVVIYCSTGPVYNSLVDPLETIKYLSSNMKHGKPKIPSQVTFIVDFSLWIVTAVHAAAHFVSSIWVLPPVAGKPLDSHAPLWPANPESRRRACMCEICGSFLSVTFSHYSKLLYDIFEYTKLLYGILEYSMLLWVRHLGIFQVGVRHIGFLILVMSDSYYIIPVSK